MSQGGDAKNFQVVSWRHVSLCSADLGVWDRLVGGFGGMNSEREQFAKLIRLSERFPFYSEVSYANQWDDKA